MQGVDIAVFEDSQTSSFLNKGSLQFRIVLQMFVTQTLYNTKIQNKAIHSIPM